MNKFILEAIDVMIDAKLKELSFNKTIEGIVQKVNENNCEILSNGMTYTADMLSGNTYKEGDIVIVLVLNNNYSNKIILGRR